MTYTMKTPAADYLSDNDKETLSGTDPVGLLTTARDYIKRGGLEKFDRVSTDGSMCIHGAVGCAIGGGTDWSEAYPSSEWGKNLSIEHALLNHRPGDTPLVDWNNHPDTTPEDVIDWLDQRIAFFEANPV